MKYYLKNTIILLFRRIDKAIFDVHRTGKAWKSRKVPQWIVLVSGLGLYFLLISRLWPFLSATEAPFLKYFGYFMLLAFTILFLVLAKIYVSQLLDYKSPYPFRNEKTLIGFDDGQPDTPFRFTKLGRNIDYENAGLFKDYLKTSKEDYLNLLAGKPISGKLVWLPLTDRKLPNFRLLFEFLNHVSEQNLEGYYGENLLRLCNYIISHFRSKDRDWSVKQLQKSHSGWKNCNPNGGWT